MTRAKKPETISWHCILCGHEQENQRITCPACGKGQLRKGKDPQK